MSTPHPAAGFMLTETLVALLLLAIAMLGAGAALVESLAGQRAALLQTRAADLAANLAEALRSAADPAAATAEIQAWQTATGLQLPQATAAVLPRSSSASDSGNAWLPTQTHIHLQWRAGISLQPAQLTLPLGLVTPRGTD